jgi:hypothetical protein
MAMRRASTGMIVRPLDHGKANEFRTPAFPFA